MGYARTIDSHHAADVNDPAGFSFLHGGEHSPSEPHNAPEVGIHHSLTPLHRLVQDTIGATDSCVVY